MNNLGDLNINTIESLAKIRRTPDESPLRGVLKHRSNKVIASLENSQKGYYWTLTYNITQQILQSA